MTVNLPPSVDVAIWCPEVQKVLELDSGRIVATLKTGTPGESKLWFNSTEHLEVFVAELLGAAGVEYFVFDANPCCDCYREEQQSPVLVLLPVDSGDEVLSALTTD